MSTAPAGDLYIGFLDPFIDSLNDADSQPLRQDGRSHLIVDPPITARAAQDWLFEGRATPPPERFRPDPEQHPAAGPQSRFLFMPNGKDVDALRPGVLERNRYTGPAWAFDEQLPDWLPSPVREEANRLNDQGRFRASRLPVVESFPGLAPWGRIVLWAGRGDFPNFVEWFFYNYFPEDLAYYEELFGAGTQKAELVHYAYKAWNDDMRYFVEDQGMKPDLARDEMKRIWGEIFKAIVEATMEIAQLGAGAAASAKLVDGSEKTAAAVLESFRDKRRLFSIEARRDARLIVVYRGHNLAKPMGESFEFGVHDLGEGTYLTTDEWMAQGYAAMRSLGGEERVVLKGVLDPEEFGRVLDLVNGPYAKEFKELLDEQLKFMPVAGERYNKLFTGFLAERGLVAEQFDVRIAPELLHAEAGTGKFGVQICISQSWSNLVDRFLSTAEEFPWP